MPLKMQKQLCIRFDTSTPDSDVLFEEKLPSSFVDLPEDDELSVESDICVTGKVYRASEWVMVEAYVTVSLTMPCAMCNERCAFVLDRMLWEQSLSLSCVKDGILNLSEPLREAILLEVPFFIRCGGEGCRNIDAIRPFLRSKEAAGVDEEKNQPFLSLLKEE